MSQLKEAKAFAIQLGQFGIADAIKISLTIYYSKYQWSFAKAEKNINKMLGELKTEDNYSKANLLIELSEVFKKAGKLQKAYELLSEVAMIIYSHQNYRQEALLNLKFAHLNQLRGKFKEALSILISAKRILKPDVDNILLLEFCGLEKQILLSLGEQNTAERVQKQLNHLTKVTGDYLNQRIEWRRQGHPHSWRLGEDLMGDILDEMDSKAAIKKTLQSGYFGLLPTLLRVENKLGYIICDLEPNSLTICRAGETYHTNSGLTPITRKILSLLSDNKPHDKENILKVIWGYDYNPLVHDPMIYGHLSRLRKQLGPFKSALIITEKGYALSTHFQLYNGLIHQPEVLLELETEKEIDSLTPINPLQPSNNQSSSFPVEELNYRQIQILQWLQKKPFVDIQIHQKIFKVSPITATRDLAELTQKGLLQRIGRARATKYSLFKQFNPSEDRAASAPS